MKNTTERGRAILGSSGRGQPGRGLIGGCKTFVLPSAEHDDATLDRSSEASEEVCLSHRSHCKICTAPSFIHISRALFVRPLRHAGLALIAAILLRNAYFLPITRSRIMPRLLYYSSLLSAGVQVDVVREAHDRGRRGGRRIQGHLHHLGHDRRVEERELNLTHAQARACER